ncbi:DUF1800 domain-containing protein [Armatimonas rosea]|uniref:Uncharacterized protein (DUF1800 family) n=1 Tax=Armatimonas rosea TaxID=685828 RepID=A0A7W9SNI7_ARMRO|nr:DUF1800 domain-containing protein [Armatimonas rosea]MBB6049881.1 uncharacterized protein (DUF1800 family) [Armatimonas rosea]
MIITTTLLALALGAAAPAPPADKALTEEQRIVHVLNRLGFGPRPGDIERVKAIGLKNYINQQLHPETLKDQAVAAKTAGYEALKLTGLEIAELERGVQMNNARLLQLQNQLAQRGATGASQAIQNGVAAAQTGTPPPPQQQAQGIMEVMRNATPEERKQLEEGRMARQRVNDAGSQLVMNKLVRAVESEKQLQEVLVDFWSNHFNIDATKVRAAKVTDEEQAIRPHVLGKFSELLKASAHSAAMMLYLDNAQSVAAQPEQPQGRFGAQRQFSFDQVKQGALNGIPMANQLMARVREIAKNQNLSEEEAYKRLTSQGLPNRSALAQRQRAGLNENYAREVMELHTLGVDGGYTQKDVTELARCLTGWGVRGGRYGGEFEFHANLHDKNPKEVLGITFPAGGGQEEGEKMLDVLANHPATIKNISTKLCRRFVSDTPPASLVNKCVATWKKTDGDIREILTTIFASPEFNSASAFKSKVKSPFEYVVSAARALGATVETAPPAAPGPFGGMRPAVGINIFAPNGAGQTNQRLLAGQVGLLGQPLFNYAFPTGYPEESSKWVSSGALIGRINFALALVNGRISDADLSKALPFSETPNKPTPAMIELLGEQLTGTPLSAATRKTLQKQTEGDEFSAKRLAALILGSPEFQRR